MAVFFFNSCIRSSSCWCVWSTQLSCTGIHVGTLELCSVLIWNCIGRGQLDRHLDECLFSHQLSGISTIGVPCKWSPIFQLSQPAKRFLQKISSLCFYIGHALIFQCKCDSSTGWFIDIDIHLHVHQRYIQSLLQLMWQCDINQISSSLFTGEWCTMMKHS